ncbi:F0F1 ATP synthase subunit A [Desulfohalovibrio reitneri]|uniref:F0F1 ATP synthase subunit A n=1 Tax=Desulfohalovibrio reitneri TaxID=1307759 RepID=UPI0004A6C121|nr:F0F1 ATP synthase subunit A [Desulfohalovibrio reitneri]
MTLKDISPDQVVYWSRGVVELNATIVWTWIVMAGLVLFSLLITSRLSTGTKMSRWQNLLEIIVQGMRDEIEGIAGQKPGIYLPFVGTLFLFIAVSNVLGALVPGFVSPTASLSTTAALAICVFVAVYIYGIADRGVVDYFRLYLKPSPLMLPFNIMGELSRTLALAVRLFGNVMSGAKIVTILLAVAPIFFPILMKALGLLTGLLQAYIFAILAMVYIAGATRARKQSEEKEPAQEGGQQGES